MKTVFLSYYFPPLKAPRATQVERLARYSRLPVRVLCASPGATSPRPGVEVHGFQDDSPRWWRMVKHFICLPDASRAWAMRLSETALRQNLIGERDVLVTFGQPMSDHLAGLYLKQRIGMRWIAHFSDPWSDNPYLLPQPFARRRLRGMEASVFKAADRLLFTSAETIELVMRKYPAPLRDKAVVLPHAFDPASYGAPAAAKQTGQPLCIRYLGNFYRQRNPRRLAEALRYLHATCPEALDNVRIELIGRWVGHGHWSPAEYGLPEGLLSLSPPVSYGESLRLMREADLLLVIDAPFEHNVFFPSKLVDYLGAGRPVLAMTPPGASARIVHAAGGRVIAPHSVEAIAEGLKHALEDFRGGMLSPTPEAVLAPYAAAEVAARFDVLVGEVAGHPALTLAGSTTA